MGPGHPSLCRGEECSGEGLEAEPPQPGEGSQRESEGQKKAWNLHFLNLSEFPWDESKPTKAQTCRRMVAVGQIWKKTKVPNNEQMS
jgi:hypothetical protein